MIRARCVGPAKTGGILLFYHRENKPSNDTELLKNLVLSALLVVGSTSVGELETTFKREKVTHLLTSLQYRKIS